MLKEGQAVRIAIKRPNRWGAAHVAAFTGVIGFIKEIKPETGNNNILVDFPEPILAGKSVHSSFHFLAEDLKPEKEPAIVFVGRTPSRKFYATNVTGLYSLVENHGHTLTWDTSSKKLRGVIWTSGDAMAGFFTIGNGHVDVTLEDSVLTEWW